MLVNNKKAINRQTHTNKQTGREKRKASNDERWRSIGLATGNFGVLTSCFKLQRKIFDLTKI